jgi:hypothetical protein
VDINRDLYIRGNETQYTDLEKKEERKQDKTTPPWCTVPMYPYPFSVPPDISAVSEFLKYKESLIAERSSFLSQASGRLFLCLLGLLGFDDTSDETSSDSATTLTDVEALAGLGSNGAVCLQDHLDVVTRHDHLRLILAGEAEGGGLV